MIRLFAGANCKGDGIMPPQMNWKDKFNNCKAIATAGKYKDIEIATYDPMEVEAIDLFTTAMDVDIRYFIHEGDEIKEIPEGRLNEMYNVLGEIYDEIDATKLALDSGFGCCCCE